MNILIIGASGLVGGNCLKYFGEKEELNVIGTFFSYKAVNTVYYDTLNADNPDNFDVEKFNPDMIIHCGALTHVDYCEDHREESYQKTVESTQNVIALCKKHDAKMVYISTDYVFDGTQGPYDEDADVSPLSIYGQHKLEAERSVLNEIDGSIVIRITNVYGDEERKKNFVVRIADKINSGETLDLKLPYDQYATPVNAHDVARALYLLIKDNKQGIYNIAGTDYVNRCQLVNRILTHFPEANCKLTPISTKEMNQPAPRPLQGGLKTGKFLSEYPGFVFTNVDDYLFI